jgi:hypothetical protein
MKFFSSLFLLLTISFSSFAQTSEPTEAVLKARNEINAKQWKQFEKEAKAKDNPQDKALGLISYGRWMLYSEYGAEDSMEDVIKDMKKSSKKNALTSRSFGYNMITFSINGAYHDTAADYGKSETKGTFKIDEKGKKISVDYTFTSTMNEDQGKKFQMFYDILYVDKKFLVLKVKGQKLYFHRQ